ncbi:hypothetical protein [Algiphilus sp.]|uniref:hypothetical protein n=1 Tax=Algiphilus sp. TaxID=1872431 RepID=UPI003CCBED97
MHRTTLAAALALAVTAAAHAQGEIRSFRYDGQLIQLGDSRADVHITLGHPDARIQLESRQGGATGQRWEYYEIGSGYQKYSLTVDFAGGGVTRMVQEIRR